MSNFHYFGLFLDTDTKNRLMDILTDIIEYDFFLGNADKIFIDHCTLLHCTQAYNPSGYPLMCSLNGIIKKQRTFKITIIGIGISKKAMAFEVKLPKKLHLSCYNETPHITIATFNGGKPIDSNSITEWKSFGPIEIDVELKKV